MRNFQRLVVPSDGSAAAQRGIAYALELARREDATLDMCCVVDEIALITPMAEGALANPSPIMATIERAATENVDAAVALARGAGITAEGTILRGSPAAQIDAFVRRRRADAIVLGTNGRGAVERWFMGGTTMALVRRSDAPVVTVHADDVLRAGPMLVAMDDSRASIAALDCAIERARRSGARLALLHVFDEQRAIERCARALGLRSREARRHALTAAEDALDDAAERVRAAGIGCATEMQFGVADATIVAAAERLASSSIAIGTHGRGELAELILGSVADAVIRAARVPVYVVRRTASSAPRSQIAQTASAAALAQSEA